MLPMKPTTTPTPHAKIVDAGAPTRKDTHRTREDSPERPGINAQTPDSMPRAEDDEATRANSPEFHDRPGSGRHTADKDQYF
jgi:hypothetical protein